MGMWKESYAVGHELIDSQHMELFRMTDDLVDVLRRQEADSRDACARALVFLKEYVVKHFADEEALQAKLGYEGLAAHCLLHRDFVATVAEYERKLIESRFDLQIVQQFTGKLIGWLIYHVVREDGKITGMVSADAAPAYSDAVPFIACFSDSASEVLSQMLSTAVAVSDETPTSVSGQNDINVSVGVIGDRPGSAEFVFPLVTALRIVQSMTMAPVDGFGDMVESALREIANIISGNAASRIASAGYACDITPPRLYRGLRPIPSDGKVMQSDLGSLAIFWQKGD
ncbi:MAG: bacteriohemerythrin [Gracilibacteraceae bacterium]|jgi:hemerythrin-like metal-binding protein|nr:bacteriohemerythrin [Gracilibacteraceae bacterium]